MGQSQVLNQPINTAYAKMQLAERAAQKAAIAAAKKAKEDEAKKK
jgi:hypothetical protein